MLLPSPIVTALANVTPSVAGASERVMSPFRVIPPPAVAFTLAIWLDAGVACPTGPRAIVPDPVA